jgi:DNA-binding MarR family transcriptional regulator
MNPDTAQAGETIIPNVLLDRVGFLFAKLHHRWANDSEARLRDAGLGLCGLHFGALSVVASSGPLSQQSLGEQLRKDRTTIVGVVDDLESAGLVERRRNPDDRRAYALQVTDAGHRWLARAEPVLIGAEDELMSDLGAEERRQLVVLLQRMLADRPPG